MRTLLVNVLSFLLAIILLLMFVFATAGYSGYELGPPCHGDRHVCETDSECEDEEAYFLDLDELAQSSGESLVDNAVNLKGGEAK